MRKDRTNDYLAIFLDDYDEVILAFFSSSSIPVVGHTKIVDAIKHIAKEGVGYKRKCTEAKFVSASCSAFGDMTKWNQHQRDLQICCHLPPAAKIHGLHVSLIAKAFGKFIDTMKEKPSEKYMELACSLVIAASKVYPNEDSYTTQFLTACLPKMLLLLRQCTPKKKMQGKLFNQTRP